MPDYKVTGGFCLEIEDVEDEGEAKKAAMEQLGDCLKYYPYETVLNFKAERINMSAIEKVLEWHGRHTEEYCQSELNIPSCEIYQAIQAGKSEEEILAIAEDVDPEIFE